MAPELDDPFAFSADGLARYCGQGRWGYLNLHGAVAIAPAFDAAAAFCHGLAAVKVANGLWRSIDTSGAFAALVDHSGHVLWQSPAGAALRVPALFFTLPATSFLDPRAAPEQLIARAESLRARTADKLRRLACDPAFEPGEAVDEEIRTSARTRRTP